MIEVKVIADSINPQGDRLTTFVVTFPRIILAEFNTHRMFSRNSASSRAIPFKKVIKMVEENPFIPIAWQKDHKGMQGNEYFTDFLHIEQLEDNWLNARDAAVEQVIEMNDNGGVTKQLCNRLLEPFIWHTVIITSSEWNNFFDLRCPLYSLNSPHGEHLFKSKKDAIEYFKGTGYNDDEIKSWTDLNWLKINKGQSEIHMMALAEAMWDAMNESTPVQLQPGEWHIPFSNNFDWDKIRKQIPLKNQPINLDIKIATAMCARVSYTVVGEEGKEPNYENDIKLHDKLLESGHFSPFEHCAKAMTDEEYQSYRKGKHEVTLMDNSENKYWFIEDESGELGWCNNFKGFIQYRYLIDKKL